MIFRANKMSNDFHMNSKIRNSDKSIKQDMFIHFRKLQAFIQNIFICNDLLHLLEENKLLFLVLLKLANSSALKQENQDLINELGHILRKFP